SLVLHQKYLPILTCCLEKPMLQLRMHFPARQARVICGTKRWPRASRFETMACFVIFPVMTTHAPIKDTYPFLRIRLPKRLCKRFRQRRRFSTILMFITAASIRTTRIFTCIESGSENLISLLLTDVYLICLWCASRTITSEVLEPRYTE